jgi:hypothetical protein
LNAEVTVVRAIRIVVLLYAFAPLLLATGCGKEEGKPNPELKVPDVPESGSGGGKGDMSTKTKKK